ncbi:MAG: RsmD family RNA methyltransferase [Thermoplasmata archaeon]|nr:RsmD family RNA methyltransferase [Thermoplasmata archaeon]
MKVWVELSGENLPLAVAELEGILGALGLPRSEPVGSMPGWRTVETEETSAAPAIAGRLALGHRVLRSLSSLDDPVRVALALRAAPSEERGSTARFDWLSVRPAEGDRIRDHLARAYQDAGGEIRLRHPDRQFLLLAQGPKVAVLRLVADIDRAAVSARRMPRMPFQRPVSLPPRLARAAVNLSRARAGELVVDPFVGTGAMLLEAAILGARVAGVDRDARMIQGALRNFAAFDQTPVSLAVEDGEAGAARFADHSVDAIVTDPPYGRASSTRGEPPESLARRVLTAWSRTVRPEGRIVIVRPADQPDPLPPPWHCTMSFPHRVHRSLTREFRVYVRGAAQ